MPWLLDTNILSELRRPTPDIRVVNFVISCPLEQIYVSVVTLAEIRFGIDTVDDPDLRTDLHDWLTYRVRPMFVGRILELTEEIMLRWRRLIAQGRREGRTFSQPDLMIAATALEHRLTLVTRNVKDFAGLQLALLNPWET